MVSKASTRLCLALGSWQLVALEAALREADRQRPRPAPGGDVLVLYETGPVSTALATAMREVAGALRPWRRVVDAFELGLGWPKRLSERHALALQARLRACVGAGDGEAVDEPVDELWLCRLDRRLERLFLETWPDARVVLYEDGVLSYLPVDTGPSTSHARLGRFVRNAWRRLSSWRGEAGRGPLAARIGERRQAVLRPHADRVDAAWMLLGDAFAAPDWLRAVDWHGVPADTLRGTIADCARLPAVAAFEAAATPSPRPRVLLLGQSLSRFHALRREHELAVYADAVATIVRHGYDVLWKEHPRSVEPFFPELAALAPERVRELALPHALPVELVATRLGVVAVAGGMTTALFYLPRVAPGIAAFSFADRFSAQLRGAWARQNDLFARRVAPLEALPLA